MGCKLVGCWRIVEADIWDRAYLDLCGPAKIVIGADARGEITFGAMQATLDVEYGPTSIAFTWIGFDEMDEVSVKGMPNCSTTAPSRLNSNTKTATRPSSKRLETVFQQPASGLVIRTEGIGFSA